jgi:hypothetical protein
MSCFVTEQAFEFAVARAQHFVWSTALAIMLPGIMCSVALGAPSLVAWGFTEF